jgi:hypothetical protein
MCVLRNSGGERMNDCMNDCVRSEVGNIDMTPRQSSIAYLPGHRIEVAIIELLNASIEKQLYSDRPTCMANVRAGIPANISRNCRLDHTQVIQYIVAWKKIRVDESVLNQI